MCGSGISSKRHKPAWNKAEENLKQISRTSSRTSLSIGLVLWGNASFKRNVDAKLWSWKQFFKIRAEGHLTPLLVSHQQGAVKSKSLIHLERQNQRMSGLDWLFLMGEAQTSALTAWQMQRQVSTVRCGRRPYKIVI